MPLTSPLTIIKTNVSISQISYWHISVEFTTGALILISELVTANHQAISLEIVAILRALDEVSRRFTLCPDSVADIVIISDSAAITHALNSGLTSAALFTQISAQIASIQDTFSVNVLVTLPTNFQTDH